MIGGILDFYFFSGPTPLDVIAQYGAIIGYPMWQPLWGFGFHLCRCVLASPLCDKKTIRDFFFRSWGYTSIWEVKDVVEQMRAANIPLEGP